MNASQRHGHRILTVSWSVEHDAQQRAAVFFDPAAARPIGTSAQLQARPSDYCAKVGADLADDRGYALFPRLDQ